MPESAAIVAVRSSDIVFQAHNLARELRNKFKRPVSYHMARFGPEERAGSDRWNYLNRQISTFWATSGRSS